MNIGGALRSVSRVPRRLGTLGGSVLDQLNPGRRHRRTWMHGGRAHIEVRAVHLPDHEALVKDLIARLGDIEGVQWAEVNAAIGRVIVDFDPEGPDLGDLLDVVEAVERHHEVVEERFPKDRAEHPADIEPLRRAAVSLGADVAGLTFSVFGQLLRVTPFPVELASLVSLAEQQPRLREFFERMVGAPATDLGLGVTSALAQAVALGPFGLAVDISLRCQQVSELRARRAAWARLEPELFSGPMAVRTIPLDVVDRPVKLRQGPIERYADRTTLASLAAFGVALPLTGSPRRAAGLVVAGLPKASRMGRETFAAVVGRELSRRDVLVVDQTALRRLDRVDHVVVDARAVLGRSKIEAIETFGAREDEVRAVVSDLFDPTDPRRIVRHGHWVVGPLPTLARLGIAAPTSPSPVPDGHGPGLLGVGREDVLVALVALDTPLEPLAEPLARAVHRAGLQMVVAGGPPWLARRLGADRTVSGNGRLARSVRDLQVGGAGVLLVAVGDAGDALAAADCSVGVRDGSAVPWGADFVTGEGLADVHLVVEAAAAARHVSTRSAQLAVVGSVLGGVWSVFGPAAGAGRRAAAPVNSAALAAQMQAFTSGLAVSRRPRPVAAWNTPWHEIDGPAALRALGTGKKGLRPDQVHERAAVHHRRPPPGFVRLPRAIAAELANPLTPVLGAGAALAASVGSVTDAGLVAGVVGANAMIGGFQRLRAEVAIERLLEVSTTLVPVRRSGGPKMLRREELVAGDLVELSVGDVVPGDCRILEADGCEVDESVLTGESLPVVKQVAATPRVELAERACMLYEGTTISSGRALAVVVAVGSDTEVGRSLVDAPEPPPSGVEARLSTLTAVTVPVTLASGAVVTAIGFLRGRSPRRAVASGVGLMVAAVPEGLPLLATVAQQAAAHRLSTRGALVRNPRTIEALGRVDTLCFDKTGTLTMGQIRLQRVSDGIVDEPVAELGPRSRAVLAAALRASPETEGEAIDLLPHATDRSVHAGAETAGVGAAEGLGGWEVLGELAFDPARGFHAVVGLSPEGPRVAVKGAPEVILPRCTSWLGPDGRWELDPARRGALEDVVERLAGRGLRVLAVAERASSARAEVADERVANMELLGFIGLADSVRPTAAEAVADLRDAGIDVVMITGDHPSTAKAIGQELGMVNGHRIMSGSELDALPDAELDARLPEISIFARVTPNHKVRIVQAYQRLGRIVAMTGDGANDAPAIRLAHAGVALGNRSSPAAREAADLVVVDDRIETILVSIVEGRAMWTSVRQALAILVGGNLGEVAFTVAATAAAGASPLVARQFLLVNLLTDMLPAMTIALRPPADRPPAVLLREGPDASLGSLLTREIALRAATTAGGALTAWTVARVTGTRARASTVALVALVGTQLGQTAVVGRESPLVLASTVVSAGALAVIVQTPGVSHFFGCRPLGPLGWGIALGASGLATGSAVLAARAWTRPTAGSSPPEHTVAVQLLNGHRSAG